MYGVSKINIEPSLMMISVQDVEFKGNSLARYLQIFADTGVVVYGLVAVMAAGAAVVVTSKKRKAI